MTISSQSDLAAMQRVGQLVARTIAHMRAAVRPGLTTAQLDDIGARFARSQGARSAPQLAYDFPGFNCLSVNEEIVHGIPGARVLREGDVVKLDVTLELDGYMADSAVTVIIPPVSPEARQLQRAARVAFNSGVAVARAGQSLREVGRAVESAAKREGAVVVRELTGHGIGRRIHEPPTVPNWGDPDARTRPVVDDDALMDQLLGNGLSGGDVNDDGTSSVAVVKRRVEPEPCRLRPLDQ